MRLTHVLMVYFIAGAVMYGGGAVDYADAGVTELVITSVSGGDIQPNTGTAEDVEGLGGPIEQALGTVGGGGLIAAWKFLSGVINFLFWPTTTAIQLNAPVEVTVMLSTLTFSFIMGLIVVFRRGS